MPNVKEQLSNMFVKVMSGTVTEEEGTFLINSLAKTNGQETVDAVASLINEPPQHITPQKVFHTVAITRNRKFFDILTATLDHRDEEVSIYACEELATYFRGEAKFVLEEHLNSEAYHVRKSSAITLVKVFGGEGIAALKRHILEHNSHYHMLTSCEALMQAGEHGISALVDMLNSDNAEALSTISEVLAPLAAKVSDQDVPKIVDALTRAGDANNSPAIIGLLKVIASFGKRVKQYEWWVRAYEDHHDSSVAAEAKRTSEALRGMKTASAGQHKVTRF